MTRHTQNAHRLATEEFDQLSPYDFSLDEHLLSKSQINLIHWMWPTTSYQYDHLCQAYRNYLRLERCGLTEAQCINLGFDIDLEGAVSLDQTLSSLASSGWLVINTKSNEIVMTSKCQNWLHSKFTRRFGSQWQDWREELQRIHDMVPSSQPEISENLAIMHYANGLSPQQASRWFRWSDVQLAANNMICRAIKRQLKIDESDLAKHKVLHLNPTLRLAKNTAAQDLTGITLAIDIKVDDKTRHVKPKSLIAVDEDRIAISQLDLVTGLFLDVPLHLSEVEICCHWTVKNGTKSASVLHNITYKLEQVRGGWFYCVDAEHTGRCESDYFRPDGFFDISVLTGKANSTGEDLDATPRAQHQIDKLEMKSGNVKITESINLKSSSAHAATLICR
ncbi:hypothetical protein GCM10011369_27600 [Neiella marina]|uniref:Uncharacterized protein n=1 Tax=Neiella marina TaxID=508461 RepID=A0A8J2U7U1_9GAMM|nr:hypothetical protein [Neiella marina]GGA84075.1 hypothetical protein GCM10011369_27600 [Neiella marina]